MSPEFFESILVQLHKYTKDIAYHILGDPLILEDFLSYLDLTSKHRFRGELVTSGFYLKNHPMTTLLHSALKQINISLNSFEMERPEQSLDQYFESIFSLIQARLARSEGPFINLRLLLLDESSDLLSAGKSDIFHKIIERLSDYFETNITVSANMQGEIDPLQLAPYVRLIFKHPFQWPTLGRKESFDGFCYGLLSHFGILSDGRVVPCCLDSDGVIELGNLHGVDLSTILSSTRAEQIREGFYRGIAVEELCRRCTYKQRFLAPE